MNTRPVALFESFVPGPYGRSFRFAGLEQVLVAHKPTEVQALLAAVEREVAVGRHAAGFLCYEAASALEPGLATHPGTSLPLAWFGIFAVRQEVAPGTVAVPGVCRLLAPHATWRETAYTAAFASVKHYIAAGDCYQVNLTWRERFRFAGEPFALYRQLCRDQPTAFCAWLECGDWAIASASPELFFARSGREIVMRPMKGTAQRSALRGDDLRERHRLVHSPK